MESKAKPSTAKRPANQTKRQCNQAGSEATAKEAPKVVQPVRSKQERNQA